MGERARNRKREKEREGDGEGERNRKKERVSETESPVSLSFTLPLTLLLFPAVLDLLFLNYERNAQIIHPFSSIKIPEIHVTDEFNPLSHGEESRRLVDRKLFIFCSGQG